MNIIFDLDGTIIDSSERLYRLFQDLILDSNLSKEDYWRLKRNKVNHQMILRRYFPDYDFGVFNEQWMRLIESEEYLTMDRNYPNTVDVLDALFGSYNLVLLTARQSKEELYKELDRLKIRQFFTVILVTEAKKSKEELLNEAINTGRITKTNDDLFVSDMGKDIEIGKQTKFKTMGITHGFMNREKLSEYQPDYLIDELTEVIEYVSSNIDDDEV